MAEQENKEVKKAADILNKMSLDPKELELYFDMLQVEFDDKISKTKLFEEGQKEKQLEIAKKALGENIDIITISKITGLAVQEIEKLQKNT